MNEERTPGAPPVPYWKLVEDALDERYGTKRQARSAAGRKESSRPGKASAEELPTLFLTLVQARQTLKVLETPKGVSPPPGVVYWLGFDCGKRACVTTLVVPAEEARSDAVLASAVADEEIFSAVVNTGLVFLGEVRLRCGQDPDRPGLRFDGAFSIDVAPGRTFDLGECRIHRRIGGECRQIPDAELRRHLRVIPGFKDLRDPRSPSRGAISPSIRHAVRV
jgi:hypothetical protein